jgi:hypothetical protein
MQKNNKVMIQNVICPSVFYKKKILLNMSEENEFKERNKFGKY